MSLGKSMLAQLIPKNNSGATSPLDRFKKLKKSDIETRPCSASQKLRQILAKSNKNSSKKNPQAQQPT